MPGTRSISQVMRALAYRYIHEEVGTAYEPNSEFKLSKPNPFLFLAFSLYGSEPTECTK